MNKKKLLQKILNSQQNVSFEEFVALIEVFGFKLKRSSGSHRMYQREGVKDMMNVQNFKGKAKPYQIKQFLKTVERYNLRMEEE